MGVRKTQYDNTKCLLSGAAKSLKKNEQGKIIQWSVKSRDGDQLKVYIESGCTTGLMPAEI